MLAGNLTIVIWLLLNVLFVGARVRVAYCGKMKASAESFGAGRAEMGADLRVTNANQTNQFKQTNSTSKPRIKSGQETL